MLSQPVVDKDMRYYLRHLRRNEVTEAISYNGGLVMHPFLAQENYT